MILVIVLWLFYYWFRKCFNIHRSDFRSAISVGDQDAELNFPSCDGCGDGELSVWCGVDGPAGGVCVVEVGVFNEGDGGVGWEVGGGWGDGCGVACGEGCVGVGDVVVAGKVCWGGVDDGGGFFFCAIWVGDEEA